MSPSRPSTLVHWWCTWLWVCFHCREGQTLSHSQVVAWTSSSRIQSHWPCMTLCPISMFSRIFDNDSAAVPATHAGGNTPAASRARPASSRVRWSRMTPRMYAASSSPSEASTSSRTASSSAASASRSTCARSWAAAGAAWGVSGDAVRPWGSIVVVMGPRWSGGAWVGGRVRLGGRAQRSGSEVERDVRGRSADAQLHVLARDGLAPIAQVERAALRQAGRAGVADPAAAPRGGGEPGTLGELQQRRRALGEHLEARGGEAHGRPVERRGRRGGPGLGVALDEQSVAEALALPEVGGGGDHRL